MMVSISEKHEINILCEVVSNSCLANKSKATNSDSLTFPQSRSRKASKVLGNSMFKIHSVPALLYIKN
ncbi:hypothetical protein F383_28085 [Gossypium arboreum]|uniref:Uncharacterized protein n=1 Tax=Gossypium arboreum TaxID=29729 RepID=A0A0B0MQZ4_GOSAR|nr:hypothetical protein F383_28085 [Gossypium arboreum]